MPADSKSLVLQATDIVDLISQAVALKRAGKDFIGLCPFHQEKTPSFHVSPSKQFYYCFGCKAGGNAIDFVIKHDRVEFKEALEILARRAGIDLPKFGGPDQKPGERQLLLEAHSAACGFFENRLASDDGLAARQYLEKRGFTADSLKRFQVGLAADSWNALLTGPVGGKFGPKLLAMAGLVKVNESGRAYDTFRNRIMFPIRDEGGRIIAFGGRIMPGSEDPAKYLNSPETPLFSKSRAIFGLDLARQRIVETRTVAICEGYTDSIMSHQFDVTNVVSVLGTAMTEQHVNVLRRFADRIVLLFDADNAGDLAVDRLVQLFVGQEIEIAVASMPAGLDPDEFLIQNGKEAFEKMLAEAPDALTHAWRQLTRKYNAANDLTGRQKAAQHYLELLAQARSSGPVDGLRWGSALAQVSRLTDVPIADLHRWFKAHRPAPRPGAQPQQAQADGPAEPTTEPSAPAVRLSGGQEQAERWLLGALLAEPARWHAVQAQVHVEDFADERRRKLAGIYWQQQQDEGEPVFNELLSSLSDSELGRTAIELVEEVERLNDLSMAVDSALKHFADARRKREERSIAAKLIASKDQPLPEQDGNDLLRKLSKAKQTPDMGRLGPRIG